MIFAIGVKKMYYAVILHYFPQKKYNQGEKLRLIILFLRKEEKFLQRSCEMNEEESRFIYENMGKILHNIASRAALQKQEKIHQ